MSSIGIVTDSSCDLPAAVAADHGVTIVPLTIRFGTEVFVDRLELDARAFWERLATTQSLPETAAPGPGAFLEVFDGTGDVDGIVCICLSSRLSGTYQAAVLAAEQASVPVVVVDSGVVSMALGLAVLEASASAESGADLETVARTAADAARRSNVYAALDTLEFLERGGRIGRVSAVVGGLLDIKPLITLHDGVLGAAGRVRTRSKAVDAIVDHATTLDLSSVAVLYSGDAPVERVSAALREEGITDPVLAELGPVVGTHTGPGVVGVAYVEA